MLKHGRPVFLDRPAVEARLGLEQYPPRVQEQFRRWFIRIAGYGVALTNAEAPASTAPAVHRGFEAAPAPPAAGTAPPAPAPEAEASVAQPAARTFSLASPDRQVLSQILGEAAPEPHPCVKEPGMACCGSGRCKTLGF
jgi:hypothetical protein